jgi:hypothetical protein
VPIKQTYKFYTQRREMRQDEWDWMWSKSGELTYIRLKCALEDFPLSWLRSESATVYGYGGLR